MVICGLVEGVGVGVVGLELGPGVRWGLWGGGGVACVCVGGGGGVGGLSEL